MRSPNVRLKNTTVALFPSGIAAVFGHSQIFGWHQQPRVKTPKMRRILKGTLDKNIVCWCVKPNAHIL